MRAPAVLLIMLIPLTLNCAHYPSPPTTSTPTGEVTVVPAFVFDPDSARQEGGKTVRTLRGCAATYVAPHLLLTSATAFPKIAPGERKSDVPIAVTAPD